MNPVKGLSREGNRREGEDQQQSRAALHVQHSTGSLQPLQHITGMLRLPLTSSSPVTCSLSFYSGARASTYLRIVPTCTLHLAPLTSHLTSHTSHLTPHTSYLIPHSQQEPVLSCPGLPCQCPIAIATHPALPSRYLGLYSIVLQRTASHRIAPHRTAPSLFPILAQKVPHKGCTLTPWLFSFLQWVCTSILRCPKQP